MANLLLNSLYGVNYTEMNFVRGMSLQFHITASCDQKCKHCYMYNAPSYEQQIKNSLDIEQIKLLIDEYTSMLKYYKCNRGRIAITGGDPILSPHFWDVLEYIKDNYSEMLAVSILGNSYHITENTANKLKELGVIRYQISIDGIKETHDHIRKEGSFNDALRALKLLHRAGIMNIVAFTISKANATDFFSLIEFLDSQDYIDYFGFDRLTPMGNSVGKFDELFTPNEYREFLFSVLKREVLQNSRLIDGRKEKMWRPLYYELGLADPISNNTSSTAAGCNAGIGTISILSDGTVYTCRRLEITAGKFPEQRLKDIIINNSVTEKLRNVDKYKGCAICDLKAYCRGCPATKYAVYGDMYEHDPYCWRCE